MTMATTENTAFDFGKPIQTLKVSDFDRAGIRVNVHHDGEKREAEKLARQGKPVPKDPDKPAEGTAKKAAEAELKDEMVKFDFDGETYEVPPIDKWSVRVFEAQEEGRIVSTVKLLLGPDQWDKFFSEPDPKHPDRRIDKDRTLPEMNKLFLKAQGALGFDQGD